MKRSLRSFLPVCGGVSAAKSCGVILAACLFLLLLGTGCAGERSVRLGLWLGKIGQLVAHPVAAYDLVMTGWVLPEDAETIRERRPDAVILAGLSHTWVFNDKDWLKFLITVANADHPDPDDPGRHKITKDMYLWLDQDGDGSPDEEEYCSPPGWEGQIYAMDPRHEGWRKLIRSFYENTANQSQHDGVIVDMVDAHPFCDSYASLEHPVPLDDETWVSAQVEILEDIRAGIPENKWMFANAGRDFPEGSPFPDLFNGYLLENALGAPPPQGFGLRTVQELLESATRALETTLDPHWVVFAVDTDNTGVIDRRRLRVGFAASLLMDNTLFAYDHGSENHGDVLGWWFNDYYTVNLGDAESEYSLEDGVYRRRFENGEVVIAAGEPVQVSFSSAHRKIGSLEVGTEFTVPANDAGVFKHVKSGEQP